MVVALLMPLTIVTSSFRRPDATGANPDLTLYDGSMGEWARDPSLPIERD
jgi:3-mercaptopyruvate sulfurtransferase SseA